MDRWAKFVGGPLDGSTQQGDRLTIRIYECGAETRHYVLRDGKWLYEGSQYNGVWDCWHGKHPAQKGD